MYDTSKGFPSIKFDLIVLCDVVHDLSDPYSVFLQLSKNIHPNGEILTIDPTAKKTFKENLELPKSNPACKNI